MEYCVLCGVLSNIDEYQLCDNCLSRLTGIDYLFNQDDIWMLENGSLPMGYYEVDGNLFFLSDDDKTKFIMDNEDNLLLWEGIHITPDILFAYFEKDIIEEQRIDFENDFFSHL